MSQNAARHDPHARPQDEDVADVAARQPEHRQGHRPRQPVGQPAGDDDDVSPDEPDEGEFELIGGENDLGAADLGPIGPNASDPDAESGRIRKITRKNGTTPGARSSA